MIDKGVHTVAQLLRRMGQQMVGFGDRIIQHIPGMYAWLCDVVPGYA
jgi:hypothetical protein